MGKLSREDILRFYAWGEAFLERHPQIQQLHRRISKNILIKSGIKPDARWMKSKSVEDIKYYSGNSFRFAVSFGVAALLFLFIFFPIAIYFLVFAFFSYCVGVVIGKDLQSKEFLMEVEEAKKERGISEPGSSENHIWDDLSRKLNAAPEKPVSSPVVADIHNNVSHDSRNKRKLNQFLWKCLIYVLLIGWVLLTLVHPEEIVTFLIDLKIVSWLPQELQSPFEEIFLNADGLRDYGFVIGIVALIFIPLFIRLILLPFRLIKKYLSVNKNAREI